MSTRRNAFLALVPSLTCLLAAPSSALQSLRERARAALGGTNDGAPLEGRGKAHAGGLDGVHRVVLAGDGRFRFELDTALPEGAAFDGKCVWTSDHAGLQRVVAMEEADRAKVFAWVLSGHWSTARELDVRELEPENGARPRLELALRDTPMVMTLTLDAKTLLPAELFYADPSNTVTWTFADFGAAGGRQLPRRWELDSEELHETYEVEAWKPLARSEGVFDAKLAPVRDVRFDPDEGAELEVERVMSGHLLVEPFVEGKSVGAFIFDTGAGAMTIDPKVADALGMPKLGEVAAVGVGGRTSASFRKGKRFELGPLTLSDPVYVELDLAFLEPVFGRKIAGIVGYDLLARCVAEIETRTPYVALHDPAKFELAGARWQELVLNENTPCVHARFEGDHEGLFRVDTGANGTVAFHAPAVRELGLLEGRSVNASLSGGVGGSTDTRSGPLAWFELAGHRFEKPTVEFSLAEQGAFTDRYTVGNIAQDFLAPFRLVLDYPDDRMAFVELAK